MAFYDTALILIALLLFGGVAVMFSSSSLRKEYMRGWDDAKKVYYDDLNEERHQEELRKAELLKAQNMELDRENRDTLPISSDLLMAYGVSTVGGLPKSVKEQYNISDKYNSMDLDTLMGIENEEV